MSDNSKQLFVAMIAQKLQLKQTHISNLIDLIDGGATIPFISRYRKEMTNGMDEVQIADAKEFYEKLVEIEKRKLSIIKSINEQNKLTLELSNRIELCWNLTELEDLYIPYKPKRRTRAEIAREKGLEPLAKIIMAQNSNDVQLLSQKYINSEVVTNQEAIEGALDIIAEWINENENARVAMRRIFDYEAIITSKAIKTKISEPDAQKFSDYFEHSEKLSRCSSHRLLAMRRGVTDGFLRVSIQPIDDEKCIDRLERIFVRNNNQASQMVTQALRDAYKRLLKPAIETEFAATSKLKADEEAILVFANNLRQLLLAAPLGQKRILAIDPGFRTGCKVVCLDAQGNLQHNETIYPHPPQNEFALAVRKAQQLVETYNIEAVAIGNGTAGRETERFIQSIAFNREVKVFVVSENGASIYSASKIARDEFPHYDVTVRGAISIGRRLMDPLAELVKIDAKSIGVGQYQHDVDQPKLKKSLDQTVESAVNKVGVDLNTASKHLLIYVSGLGPQLAQNIVDYRSENGAFGTRKQLLQVPKMGAKTFEQCAGFLRISNAENPLDNSAVHPESYGIVEKMAKKQKVSVSELIRNKNLIQNIELNDFVNDKIGLPTLRDIVDELEKPGRDPRSVAQVFEFDANIKTFDDLKIGLDLPGIVTNITNFGAFVDIGIKENGLIHISNMSEKFIKNPAEVLTLHQHVQVQVLEMDKSRKRLQLKLLK